MVDDTKKLDETLGGESKQDVDTGAEKSENKAEEKSAEEVKKN